MPKFIFEIVFGAFDAILMYLLHHYIVVVDLGRVGPPYFKPNLKKKNVLIPESVRTEDDLTFENFEFHQNSSTWSKKKKKCEVKILYFNINISW